MRFAWIIPAFLILGCGRGFAPKSAASSRAFTTVYTSMPTSLDPADSQDVNTNDFLSQVFEGLTAWGEDNKLAPSLASSWEILDRGTRYRFHLRKGVKFSNGKLLTAQDVKWSWERSSDSKWGSPLALNYLGDIVGVKEKLAGRVQSISGLKVIDDLTLDVTIDQPRAYFLGKLSYPTTFVIAANSIASRAQPSCS